MTTKKYADFIHKQTKGVYNIMVEQMFSDYVLYKDGKRIGVLYFITVMSFFFVGGIFALLLRLELMLPGKQFFSPDIYNQLMTLHGTVMVFI